MFALTYLNGELRHRSRQAMLVAAGIAVGVALAVTTSAAAAAVGSAQRAVLHALAGVGTDITVTAEPPSDGHGGVGSFREGDGSSTGLSVAGGAVMEGSTVDAVVRLPHVVGIADSLVLTEISPPPAGPAAIPATTRIDGVDVTRLGLGPYAAATVRTGRSLSASDAHAAVIDTRLATARHLGIGSPVTVSGTPFTVVGIVDQPAGSGAASIYLPLAAAQQLPAGGHSVPLSGKVSTIYISAATAADIGAVEAELAALLPAATLTSSRDLADAVSGSLASAATLAHDLAAWLTIGVLLAAAAAASLLTLASVTRRTQEFGTLKALGWTGWRIVTQLMTEAAVAGLAGAAFGVAIGYTGVDLINAVTPPLTATVGRHTGPGTGADSLAVHLDAHVSPGMIMTATVLALTAALIAGVLAGWRATRLQPAHALTTIE